MNKATKTLKTETQIPLKHFYSAMFEESLNHKMELPYENVLVYLEAVESYNEFYYTKVRAMLDEIDSVIPKVYYNEGNPNNGKRAYEIEIGREGSPVIYLKVVGYLTSESSKKPVDTAIENVKKIEEIAKSVGLADEIDHEVSDMPYGYKKIEFRFWWD